MSATQSEAHILTAPAAYRELLAELANLAPIQAALELSARGWKRLYGGGELEFSIAMADITDNWVFKITLKTDHGYEAYLDMLTSHEHSCKHVPRVVAYTVMSGGSIALMERLQPLGSIHRSLLLQKQRGLHEAFRIQVDHVTFKQRKPEGTYDHLVAAIGSNDDDLLTLVEILAATAIVPRLGLDIWKSSDILRRANGEEVLVDPF